MTDSLDAMREMGEALARLLTATGMAAIERATSAMTPDTLMKAANESIKTSMKEALIEIVGGDSSFASDLIDRFYQELDDDAVIEKIAPALTTAMVDYFKSDPSALIDAVINELDLDPINDLIARNLTDRITLKSE